MTFRNPAMIRKIFEVVTEVCHVSKNEILGKDKTSSIVDARHIAIWITNKTTDYSFSAIGRIFGDRDHGTITHAIKRIDELVQCKNEKELRNKIQDIQDRIAKAPLEDTQEATFRIWKAEGTDTPRIDVQISIEGTGALVRIGVPMDDFTAALFGREVMGQLIRNRTGRSPE